VRRVGSRSGFALYKIAYCQFVHLFLKQGVLFSVSRELYLSKITPFLPGDVLSYGLIGSIDTVRERIAAYETAGVQELVLWVVDVTKLESIQRFAREFVR